MYTAALLIAMMAPGQGGETSIPIFAIRIGPDVGTRRIQLGHRQKITIKNSPGAIIYFLPSISDDSTSILNRSWRQRNGLFARIRERRLAKR